MSYALPTTSDWEWVPSAREGSARAFATRCRLTSPNPSLLFCLLDHFRAGRYAILREGRRPTSWRGTGGDLDASGIRDARLIRGVGLGRFGLLGEEVGVFLEGRLAEDLSRERRVSEIFDSRRLSASKKAPFSDDDAGTRRRLP